MLPDNSRPKPAVISGISNRTARSAPRYLTALELLVAFLQAYVFAVLTCIYLNDALHPGH